MEKKHNLCKTCADKKCLLRVEIESSKVGVRVCAMYQELKERNK